MLTPTRQAQSLAAANFNTLRTEITKQQAADPRLQVASKIADGEPLNVLEQQVASQTLNELAKTDRTSHQWFQLMGGFPMLKQLSGDSATVAAYTDNGQIVELAAFTGTSLTDDQQLDLAFIAAELAATTPQFNIEQHRTTQDGTVICSEKLFTLANRAAEQANRHGLHTIETPNVLKASVQSVTPTGTVIGIQVTVDQTINRYPLPSVMKAAAEQLRQPKQLSAISKQLNQLENELTEALATLVAAAAYRIIEKLGARVKQRNRELQTLTNIGAVAEADQERISAAEVDETAAQPIADMKAQMAAIIETFTQRAALVIQTNLLVNVDSTAAKFDLRAEKAALMAEKRLIHWINWVVATPRGELQLEIDDFDENTTFITPPPSIVENTKAVIGGATFRGDRKLPTVTGSKSNTAGTAVTGAATLLLIKKALSAWRGETQQGITLQLPEQSETKEAAAMKRLAAAHVRPVFVWRTKDISQKIPHPDHEPLYDLLTTDLDDFRGERPGTHAFCRCWIETTLQVYTPN